MGYPSIREDARLGDASTFGTLMASSLVVNTFPIIRVCGVPIVLHSLTAGVIEDIGIPFQVHVRQELDIGRVLNVSPQTLVAIATKLVCLESLVHATARIDLMKTLAKCTLMSFMTGITIVGFGTTWSTTIKRTLVLQYTERHQ